MAFVATVRRWGNALGVTLPKEVAKKLGIGPETRVEVEVRPVPPRIWGTLKGITYEEALRELEQMEKEDEEAEREEPENRH